MFEPYEEFRLSIPLQDISVADRPQTDQLGKANFGAQLLARSGFAVEL